MNDMSYWQKSKNFEVFAKYLSALEEYKKSYYAGNMSSVYVQLKCICNW